MLSKLSSFIILFTFFNVYKNLMCFSLGGGVDHIDGLINTLIKVYMIYFNRTLALIL